VATLVPEQYREAYMLNPLATLMTEMRATIVDPSAPHPWDIAGPGVIAVSLAIVFAALVLGYWVFSRAAPRIAEEL